MAEYDAPIVPNAFWNDYFDYIVEFLPFPIVVSLALSLLFPNPKVDHSGELAYAFIAFYELLKMLYSLSKYTLGPEESLLSQIWGSRHTYRGMIAGVFFSLTNPTPFFSSISEFLYFSTLAIQSLAIELGLRFPGRRAAFKRFGNAVKRSPTIKNLRAISEIIASPHLLILTKQRGSTYAAVSLLYFFFVIIRGIAADIHHGYVYRKLADLMPLAVARSRLWKSVEYVFDGCVIVSDLLWRIEAPEIA
jgi:hypothetical protein